jgi:hypothetical protein
MAATKPNFYILHFIYKLILFYILFTLYLLYIYLHYIYLHYIIFIFYLQTYSFRIT